MVSSRRWVPARGDLVWLTCVPQAGREQGGHRPALVLSPEIYNDKTNLAAVCPITSQTKVYPFEVRLPSGGPVEGCVLTDHLKNVDWNAREAKLIGHAPTDFLARALERIGALLGL